MIEALRCILEDAHARRIFSGAQLGVWSLDGGEEVLCVGTTCWPEHGGGQAPARITPETRFDLASVTKGLVTAPLVWFAVAERALSLEDPVDCWLSDWAGRGRGVTVRQLLNHTSGLPAWLPLYQTPEVQAGGAEALRAAVLAVAPEAAAAGSARYSDLGYMLLGWMLERALHAPLDTLAREVIFEPLKMEATRFVSGGARLDLAAVAATEATSAPGGLGWGQVHDEHAAVLGGVAGHAGVFSTAGDVLRWGRAVLACDGGGEAAWPIPRGLIRWMLSPGGYGGAGSYVGGLDTPSGAASTAGTRWSRAPLGAGIGHLGFTGTSVWLDRPRQLAGVLLTNRVHPSRDAEGIREVRAAVYETLAAHAPPTRPLYPAAKLLGEAAPRGPQLLLPRRGAQELAVATATIREAGALARRWFEAGEEGLTRSLKGEVDLVTNADVAVQALILERLQAAFPTHDVLAEEEQEAGGGREGASCRWIVDPIDGTTNFSHGLPHFAVLLALEVEGTLQLGLTYDPMRDELFCARRHGGAWLNGRRLRTSRCARLGEALMVTGFPYDRRTRERNNTHHFAALLRQTQGGRRLGSAGLDLAYVAAGRLDLYWEQHLKYWDIAAGLLLVEEAGGRVTRFDGSGVDARADQVVATGGAIHAAALAALAAVDAALDAGGMAL